MSERPVRFGILSTAKIGRRIVDACAAVEGAELVAVSSRDAAKLADYCAEFGVADSVRRHASYEALLADPEVDAIYNPLPNSLHAEWTIKALEAGKHVLCEKPFAVDVAECRAMIAAAERCDRVLMEAFMYRYHPATRRIREVIEAGRIGQVQVVRAGFCFTINDPANIRVRADVAGGASMDVGCYCVNFCRLVTGEEPVTAFATATFGPAPEHDVDYTLVGHLIFPSGAVGQFECSVKSAGRSFANVLGSGGTIQVDSPWFPNAERAVFRVNGEDEVVEGGGNSYEHETRVFCAAVRDGQPLPLPPLDGARTMAALVALQQSARSGQPVAVEQV